MSRIYRTTYTAKRNDGSKLTKTPKKWYGEFTDLLGRTRRTPLCTDKRASQQALDTLIEALSKVSAHMTVKPDDIPLAVRKPFLRALRDAGHRGHAVESAQKPLADHLNDWRAFLVARGNTSLHVQVVTTRARKVIEGCGFQYWCEISPLTVQTFLANLKAGEKKRSIQTMNFYLQSIQQFCRWMLREERAFNSPLGHLQGGNVKVDRRHDRRALTDEELKRLLKQARSGPTLEGMTGAVRAVLYQLVVETGLRQKEVRSLTPESLRLDDSPPTATVQAAYSKHRREDVQPIRSELAKQLRPIVAKVEEGQPVFPLPTDRRRAVAMLKADLKAAGILYKDKTGRFADFRALRHTFITNLAKAGVPPTVAMDLARHSDINLTMSRYSHTVLEGRAEALQKLPDLREKRGGRKAPKRGDGRPTDGSAGPGNDGHQAPKNSAGEGPYFGAVHVIC